MCQYSLEGFRTRDAKQGETLHAATDHCGAFSTKANSQVRDQGMVCIKYGQTCTLENLQVHPRLHGLEDKVGKTHVVKLMAHAESGVARRDMANGDHFVFADGTVLASMYLRSPIYIGLKVDTDKGVAAIDKAVDEGLATTIAVDKTVDA
jgi:hypothetical protein